MHKFQKKFFVTSCLVSLMASMSIQDAQACSRVLWAEGNQVLVGRTQDWTEKVDSRFHKFPRGIERTAAVGKNPLKWTSKYGSLVLTGYDMGTHEGVNEKGLAGRLLYLAEGADFGVRDPNRPAINILEWVQYYLDNYATVAEAVAEIEKDSFQIESMTLPNGKPTLLHLSLEDKTGDSAVIEYLNGRPKIFHDRRFTVMTNEPTYDKQIENLKQYRSFGGDKPLPGERTPSDRFVRAAYYVNALPKTDNADTAAAYMFSVMRNVSVPFGAADPDKPNVANTIFRSVTDLKNERYFFESTYAPNVVWIDYGKLDYSARSSEETLDVEKKIHTLTGDVTKRLQKSDRFVFAQHKE